MKIRHLFLGFSLLFINVLSAQSFTAKPDYTKIKTNIEDKKSNLYYESLMNRFVTSDSTLTLNEKQHLYYGFIFSKKYDPYGRGNTEVIYKKLKEADTLKINYKEILGLCEKHIADNPFDLRIYNVMLYINEKTGDKGNFDKILIKFRTILDAITQSGNGKTKETAIYVIYVSHEYDILNILGFEYGGEQRLVEHYDYLKLAENKSGIAGLYFDISPSLDHLDKMLK